MSEDDPGVSTPSSSPVLASNRKSLKTAAPAGGLFDGLVEKTSAGGAGSNQPHMHMDGEGEETFRNTPKLSNARGRRVAAAPLMASEDDDPAMLSSPPPLTNNVSPPVEHNSRSPRRAAPSTATSVMVAAPPLDDEAAVDEAAAAPSPVRKRPASPFALANDSDDTTPVTDKLLGLLKGSPAPPSSSPPPSPSRNRSSAPQRQNHDDEQEETTMTPPDIGTSGSPADAIIPSAPAPPQPELQPQPRSSSSSSSSSTSWLGGWFGSSSSSAPAPAPAPEPEPVVPEPEPETAIEEKAAVVVGANGHGPTEEELPTASGAASEPRDDPADDAEGILPVELPEVVEPTEETTADDAPPADSVPEDEAKQDQPLEGISEDPTASPRHAEIEEVAEAEVAPPTTPPPKPMNEADRRALDDAFQHQDPSPHHPDGHDDDDDDASDAGPSRPRGMGKVHADTPVPNADIALRLLRRFAYKTQAKISTVYGGTKPRTIMSYLFTQKEDPTFVPYKELTDIIFDEDEDREDPYHHELDSSDRIVDSVMGESADTMARAKEAVAAFVFLFSMWGHASSTLLDEKAKKSTQETFSVLLSASLDTATQLVAHGCLDGVLIGMGNAPTSLEYYRAVHMLAQSVFNADLTLDRNELSALKFLLTTGCRITPDGDALLRGTHLLQTIRTLYHVYLTTESQPNKTTARASLQQLVTSVFTRLVQADPHLGEAQRVDNFPSENHRDSFLVLRSVCKLSMRSLPDTKSGRYSHVGLQTSGSNDTWDGAKGLKNGSDRGGAKMGDASERLNESHEHAQLIYTAAIHPALESKLLALELLQYVLQHVEFSKEFISTCGQQFHAAIRNYLCVSLLKNCTSDDTRVVNLSLRIFVPLLRSFRSILKNEIEAFVTNVFFVILDSSNTPAEVKCLVVKTFDEICSDPSTLAEIFLNYDCDLSAVDLFHRIVNTLSKVSRTGLQEPKSSGMSFMGGTSAARMEKHRIESRELRLDAMRALRQVLASLHASIVEPLAPATAVAIDPSIHVPSLKSDVESDDGSDVGTPREADSKQNLVEIYGSKKKRKAEESEVILRFNQKPSAGIAYATKCKLVDGDDPADVARYLLLHKDSFEKTQIGEYLGREPEYQNGFSLKVLHEYVRLMDFTELLFDEAIRYFLSGFRLPGEAQKIDRIMEKFAERYTEQNPDVFPTADAAFILSFSIIMLNTDLHNPAIKEERRMTKQGFIRNNRGICDGQDLPEELLISIFDRIKESPISLKEDEEARERIGSTKAGMPGLNPASFFTSHYDEMDRARESNFQKERDHIVRTTESLLKRRRHSTDPQGKLQAKAKSGKSPKPASKFVMTEDSGLRDEYVSPMFEVAWGPALAAFATAIESANGTIGSLISIASDEELELAAENAAETIEVCLTGFRFAICTAGLCGNDTARDAYMLALSRFSQLGTGSLLEARHIRCVQTMLGLAKDDGELLGSSWSHIFRALSEINRFHQLFHLMARNDRAAAAAAERRRRRMNDKERKRKEREHRKAAAEDGESIEDPIDDTSDEEDSLAESALFSDDDMLLEEDMDAKAIDEANARNVYEAVSETLIEAIYERSSSLSAPAAKAFVVHLCIVSSFEISVGGGEATRDLNSVTYRQQHALLASSKHGTTADQFHHSQPNIYNLQKLVEVTHYNMESRPRMIFAELWAVVSDHLTSTALHRNPAIAMYAVDSFRQLSIQYLQRDELEVFEFQRRFLKPLEVVMARSVQASTKELLLDCVDRVIHVFSAENAPSETMARKGGLKSGWVPILAILGIGGRDDNNGIAKASYRILAGELEHAMSGRGHPTVMLSDHFVETVDALLMHVHGPHDELSLDALEQVSLLTAYLATETIVPPQLKRKLPMAAGTGNADTNQELELWWPILLGLSRSIGDSRFDVRSKGLQTLMSIIDKYFLPPIESSTNAKGYKLSDDLQNLQLIFRGILFPILEFAEFDSQDSPTPGLPKDFQHFLGAPRVSKKSDEGVVDLVPRTNWLETTFDPFMDACVALCLRSSSAFGSDALTDEMFALINACLLSDSGLLAVRGLQRLEQFVTSDLPSESLTDDCWATVSHMLRRCLAVRDLPRRQESTASNGSPTEVDDPEYEQSVREFVAEENMLSDRRYIGPNATMVIGMLLSTDRFAIGLRWRLFLIAGLGNAILQWEQAAEILESRKVATEEGVATPPKYYETSLYGRKWMNRFLLQLASMKELVQAPSDADMKTNRFAAGQRLTTDEIQRLLTGFLAREKAAAQYRHTERDEVLHNKFTALVMELLSGLNKMDSDHLKDMAWIDSVLLGTCIQSKNEDIRMAVQKLVQRTSPTPNPYPMPVKPQPPAEVEPAPVEVAAPPEDYQGSAPPTDVEPAPESNDDMVSDVESEDNGVTAEAEPAAKEDGSPIESSAAEEIVAPDDGDAPAAQELTSAPSDEAVYASAAESLLDQEDAAPSQDTEELAASEAPPEATAPPPPAEGWNPMSWFSSGSSGAASASASDSDSAPTNPVPTIEPSLTDEDAEAKDASKASEEAVAAPAPVDPVPDNNDQKDEVRVDGSNHEEPLPEAIPHDEDRANEEALVVD